MDHFEWKVDDLMSADEKVSALALNKNALLGASVAWTKLVSSGIINNW